MSAGSVGLSRSYIILEDLAMLPPPNGAAALAMWELKPVLVCGNHLGCPPCVGGPAGALVFLCLAGSLFAATVQVMCRRLTFLMFASLLVLAAACSDAPPEDPSVVVASPVRVSNAAADRVVAELSSGSAERIEAVLAFDHDDQTVADLVALADLPDGAKLARVTDVEVTAAGTGVFAVAVVSGEEAEGGAWLEIAYEGSRWVIVGWAAP